MQVYCVSCFKQTERRLLLLAKKMALLPIKIARRVERIAHLLGAPVELLDRLSLVAMYLIHKCERARDDVRSWLSLFICAPGTTSFAEQPNILPLFY